jgi:hypothetical protein
MFETGTTAKRFGSQRARLPACCRGVPRFVARPFRQEGARLRVERHQHAQKRATGDDFGPTAVAVVLASGPNIVSGGTPRRPVVRKALAGEHRQVPFFALLEEVAEARGTSGPVNAKGGSSYSVALRAARRGRFPDRQTSAKSPARGCRAIFGCGNGDVNGHGDG